MQQITLCKKCNGYIEKNITWNSTIPPKVCTCHETTHSPYGWTCPRCYKINSPWKGNCDCEPPSNTQDCETKV